MRMAKEMGQYESLQRSNSTLTTQENLQQRCCKVTYKPRYLKNKGAILVLIWNYLIMNLLTLYISRSNENGTEAYFVYMLSISLTLPVAGWLADARIGRYRVIRCSIWIIWIATVLATVSSVTAQLVEGYSIINTKVFVLLFVLMAIGLGGYHVNIIQFGLDQLYDASTTEIKSFIVWHAWTLLSAGFITDYIFACLNTKTVQFLYACFNATLALVSMIIQHNWLIKEEPVKQNAIKQAYTELLNMPSKQSDQEEVYLPTVKMSFLLGLTLVRVNMEDHSQQSRWKMSKHVYSLFL